MKQVLTTGILKSPHGIKGFIKVHPFAEDYGHFFKLKNVKIQKNGKTRDLEVEQVLDYKNELLIKFAGIDTPEDARFFSGWDLLVPREQASKLDNGQIYTADLIGMKLIYDKEEVGEVVSVMEGSQALLMEVKDGQSKMHIIPYLIGIFIDEVDASNMTIKLLKKELIQ